MVALECEHFDAGIKYSGNECLIVGILRDPFCKVLFSLNELAPAFDLCSSPFARSVLYWPKLLHSSSESVVALSISYDLV